MGGFARPMVYHARGMATSPSKPPSPATTPSTADTAGSVSATPTSSGDRVSIFDIDAPRYRKTPDNLGSGAGAYATSIFSKTKDLADVVRTAKDLEKFLNVLSQDNGLAAEVMDSDAEPRFLQSFLSKYCNKVPVSPTTKDLFAELTQKSSFGQLTSITQGLYRLINAGLGFVEVKVVAANKNTQVPDEKEIAKQLDLPKGTTVRVSVEYNPDLLGGYILQTEDKLLDNSYKKDVDALDAEITQYYHNKLDKEIAAIDAKIAL